MYKANIHSLVQGIVAAMVYLSATSGKCHIVVHPLNGFCQWADKAGCGAGMQVNLLSGIMAAMRLKDCHMPPSQPHWRSAICSTFFYFFFLLPCQDLLFGIQ